MEAVQLVEVGPRDGLQNEAQSVSTAVKVQFIEALRAAGHTRIEIAAFVSPKAVPQLGDAVEVCTLVPEAAGLRRMALVPNEKGAQRALECGLEEWAVFTAASETFNQRNINATVAESLERFLPVMALAKERQIPVRGYVSTILHCPYEGPIDPARTVALTRQLLDLGCFEVSLGETIGKATPNEVRDLCRRLLAEGLLGQCAGHFHDTYGMGVANVLAAYGEGVRCFDSSAGGLGGCPYAPGALGNVATEDLLHLFHGMGVGTGVDVDRALAAARVIEEALQRPLPGRTYQALRATALRRAAAQ